MKEVVCSISEMPNSEPYNKLVLFSTDKFMLNGLRGIEPSQETTDFSPLEDVISSTQILHAIFFNIYLNIEF